MPEGNTLIATPQEGTTGVTGVGIAESSLDLANGVSTGDWVEAGLGAVGVGLEVLSMVIDPVGTVASYGVGWLIEHVQPLKEALDWFAGDPPVIRSFSETWGNVATEVGRIAQDYSSQVPAGTAGWQGAAADAYRGKAAQTADALAGAGVLAEGISAGVMIMGEVVAAVRELVRELVAEVVGRLISWALEVIASLGLATPLVVAQASAAVAKTVSKIADLVRKLVKTIGNVTPRIRKIIDKLDEIIAKLANLARRGNAPDTPRVPDTPHTPRSPSSDGPHHAPDTTSPSSTPDTSPSSTTPDTTRPSSTSPDTTSSSSTSTGPSTTSPSGTSPTSTSPSSTSPDTGTTPSTTRGPDGPTSPDGTTRPQGTSPDGTSTSGSPGGNGIRDNAGAPRDHAVPAEKLRCEKDPVDVASGRMVMRQVDAELLGILPLIVQRLHLSSYRVGGVFGAAWMSTLDQRLEVEDDGIHFAADDGTLQVFPHPAPGTRVLSAEGPRRYLTSAADGGYTLTLGPRGRTLLFGPGGPVRPLAAIVDRDGHRIDFLRDEQGVPVELRHSGGYRVRVESEAGLVRALYLCEADDGRDLPLMHYTYAENRLVEVVNSSGRPIRFEYDHADRVIGWTDRNGTWYRYVYDGDGRVVRTEGSDGILSGTMEYDLENRITYSVDSFGARTAFFFNEAHQVVREVDPLGNMTVSEWDRCDRLLSRTDPLGHTTRFEYDEQGNVTTFFRPDGSRDRYEYNNAGLLTTAVDANGAVRRYEYDERGHLVKAIDPVGAVTTMDYDERGALTRTVDALGNVREIVNDLAGLPIRLVDPLGAVTRFDRDSFGRIIATIDPNGTVTRFGWTIDGNLWWRTLPDGSSESWSYDGEGNLRTHVDPLGQVTRTEVTYFDLPAAEIRPDGSRLEFTYDTELRLVGVTNEQGLVWRYEHDAAGNVIRETDFNGRTITYRYDGAGRLIERTNGVGETTIFVRNHNGKVVERHGPAGVATFSYDAVGRLAAASDDATAVFFTRDQLGRVLTETINDRTVASEYDLLGRRVHRRTPSGVESRWRYDGNDLPIELHTAGRTLRFDYDPSGRELSRRLGTGAIMTQEWDVNHQLVTQTITSATGRRMQKRSFGYRADGFLTGVDDLLTGRRDFILDGLGRVTSVQGPGWNEQYSYDAAGNVSGAEWPVLHQAEASGLGDRIHSGTLVRGAGQTRFEHDPQGRIVLKQKKRLSRKPDTWRYEWDSEDRLRGVITPDGTHWRYSYDPLGRRVAKERLDQAGTEVVERVEFVWDGVVLAEQLHHRTDPTGNLIEVTSWEYEPRTFRPVIQNERSTVRDAPQEWIDQQFYAIVTDIAGAPTELVNDAGGIAWFHRFTLWGNTLQQSSTGVSTPLRFAGQYADAETGFHYNYFRHYDPDTGRYASADPLGLAAGPNPHRYVQNPLGWIDPMGLVSCTLQEYANSLRGENQASTPRVAAEYTSPSGRTHRGHAREGLEIPDELRHEMEQIAPLSNRHGACAEVNALVRAYIDEGPDAIRGGSMESVRVRPTNSGGTAHGTGIDPCPPYCQPLLARLGIGWTPV